MCMSVLSACLYVYHMYHGDLGGQNEILDLLKLELRMVVSHSVDAGNGTWVLCQRNGALNC